ncbi:GGDEF domain-containing protein [Solihabitans fulvus]|uniref:GGDEF domain-containing protein n=1 Tax=Solihabitans fulvus TaxID=1892852 RepID=A0A5B2XTN3_9PSEU|nr:GGDEF domain-containing protein [Solihabitans fulvus]KAA2267037.1 GGDEF domain-containing protein [Solihabitans fulvus]
MWSLPRGVLAYLLAVECLAVVGVVATARLAPITSHSLMWCGLLVVGAVAHLETARGIERIRELAAEGSPHAHLQSIWIFAGLLLLPPPLVVVVIAVSYAHSWVRVYHRRTTLHRKVFSAATVVLGCCAAGSALTLASAGHAAPYLMFLGGPWGLVALTVAAAAYFLVNYVLVVAAIIATNPETPGRTALGSLNDALTIGAAVGLGSGIALVTTVRPWLLPILMVTVLALHRGLLLPQFQAAARTDTKTGLVDPVFWHEVAGRELVRARRLGSMVAVLIIDLDHFKRVNDRYGHLAGDQVLREVANAIRREVRGVDLVGRYGGEEFAVVLPGTNYEEFTAIADRIRTDIGRLSVRVAALSLPATVDGLSASIGAAVYPDSGTDLTALLLAADAALYEAKDGGRNQIRLAASAHQIPQQVQRP